MKRRGFTIVELLIVIVVIAILAAISIVAFNGISERARMSAAVSFESQLRKKYLTDSTGNWSFDECTGSLAGNNGAPNNKDTISGTATWITDTPSGSGCALRFNGSTQIQTQSTIGGTYYVKGAWIRVSATTCNNNNVISQATTGGANTALYMPGGCRLYSGNTTYSAVASPQAMNDNKWHYVAIVWENSTMTLYVDGNSVSTASGVNAPSTSGYVSIGSHLNANFMVGDIDNPFVASQ